MTGSLKFFRLGVKPVVFLLMAWPAGYIIYQTWAAFSGLPHQLGFNPVEVVHHFTGDWAIRFLLLGLAVSPLAKVKKLRRLMLLRRMVGLFAAFYSLLHVTGYLWLDLDLSMTALWQDVIKRNYITVGMGAFLLLVPLTLTSFQRAVRYLGAKRWQRLHKLVYIIGALAVVHFFMMRKGFQLEPIIYMAIYAGLMVMRWPRKRQRHRTN